jgi:hypothetical protein
MKQFKIDKVVNVLITEYGNFDLPSNIEFKLGENVRVNNQRYTINNIDNYIETDELGVGFLTKIYHTKKTESI